MAAVKPAQVVLLMGVAGCGKTTVGQLLARQLGWSFADADEFHPPANVAKMSAGLPLTDGDRAPWLTAIRRHIADCLARGENAVVTCSALKESYRKTIVADSAGVRLVYLQGSRDQLWARISGRKNHFMKPAMLDSQLTALEEPAQALTVGIAPPPEDIVTDIRRGLSL
ncbi:MAG: gluconokinase [Opitutaceae bacterium]|nr:gluconokinase [Opitutaceae bacterium]MBP9912583.1 gluconokinase [Opitutaceae bacterium]